MKQIIDIIKPYISEWVVLPLALLLIILSGMLFFDLGQVLPSESTSLLTPTQLVKLVVIIFLLLLSMTFCYILLYRTFTKKPNIKDYDLINPPGFLKHKKTGKYYCQPCLLKDHIASELSSVVTEKHLVCHCCDKAYNISANLITNSYLSKAYDEAMKEIHLKDTDG